MYLVRPPYLLKSIFQKAVWRKDTSQKKIYLTFDDGPVPAVTPLVLDILDKHKITATFFCVGENVSTHQDIYLRILNEGHRIGNHTCNHLNGWNTHTDNYLKNIEKCEAILYSATPDASLSAVNKGSKLFRPPYGKLKKSQYSTLRSEYSIIMWDVLSGDYDKNTSAEECLQNVITNIRNGSIIVFHDSYKAQKNVEYALPRFIEYAKSNGFEFGVL